MSASNINELLQIWASTLPDDEDPPFVNKQHLYDTIDKIELGDAPWRSFSVSFDGEVAEGDATPWKQATYDVWYRDPHVVLKNQLKNPDFANEIVPLAACPQFEGNIRVFPSAISIYYAPSDKSGIRGMFRERIRAVQSWRKGPARYDCVFVERDPDLRGFRGSYVARVRAFLSITHNRLKYPCALISWFSTIGDSPYPDTGMWMVEPDFDQTGNRAMSIIHIDSILRSADLMGVSGSQFIPHHLTFNHTLEAFHAFYVNKYIDHHAHEITF